VKPEYIKPELVHVLPGSEHELIFRYAALHWNIPASSGYGRRARFLVRDSYNNKLIGIIGLCDPVFNLGVRDKWIGWNSEAKRDHLCNVLEAFILGAVPPYSNLLCGKLVASLVASSEVRQVFCRKYRSRKSIIRRKAIDSRIALVTTMSALGRSSIYNRLRYEARPLFNSLGYSQGSGEFHFANGLYGALLDYATKHCEPTAKKARWGAGFRNRREVIRKCLMQLELSPDLLYHGIQREVFAVPLAINTREFLRGEQSRLRWNHLSVNELFQSFRERWLLPRASRDDSYAHFDRAELILW
jgi:uncharacterized protein DUF4338